MMPDDENKERRLDARSNRNWQSARTILDALILAGIIAIITAQFVSHDQIASNASDSRAQFATLSQQLLGVQTSIADVPALRDKVTTVVAKQAEITRRLDAIDALHDRLGISIPERHR